MVSDLPDWADKNRMSEVIAKQVTPAEEMRKRIEGIVDGSIRPTATPWLHFSEIKAAMPGSVNVVCGDPGSAKSLMVLQWFHHAHQSGNRVAIYELEGQRQWHLMRLLVQMSGVTNMTNIDWIQGHHEEAQRVLEEHWHHIDSFGACIATSPTSSVTTEEILQWVNRQLESGVKLIGIDPITAIQQQDKPWIEDQILITQLRRAVDKHHASAVIVTHPVKGRKHDIAMDVVAGGTAMVRFSDVVLWIERSKPNDRHIMPNGKTKDATEIVGVYPDQKRYTSGRVLHVLKCRDGTRSGDRLSMSLSPSCLRMADNGWIHDIEEHDEPIAQEQEPW